MQLFNGKDLTGWMPVGKEKWTVENGIIQGKTLTDGYGYLKTDKPYKDFHLSVKFLCVGSGNSGVFFHSDFKPGTADVSQGLQFEVDCNIGQHTGGIYGDGRAVDRVAVTGKRDGRAQERVERVPAQGRGQSLHLAAQWRADGRLHRPAAEVV